MKDKVEALDAELPDEVDEYYVSFKRWWNGIVPVDWRIAKRKRNKK